MFARPSEIPDASQALPGRDEAMRLDPVHSVLGTSMFAPFPEDCEQVVLGMGCFWGAERKFWETEGVYSTAAGYAGGTVADPDYKTVCTGSTGHAEVVLIVFDPAVVSYEELLRIFWESHDPTQGMRQGNDVGTQYRSGVYTFSDAQRQAAEASRDAYQKALEARGLGAITTEIEPAQPFYFAEEYHQQYLAKVPNGYCGLGGTGVSCPVGVET